MKTRYRQLCEEESSIPLFSQPWWLDAVVGDAWDVILVEKKGKVIGSLPFVIRKKLGCIPILTQPKLTQTLGPWVRPSQKSYPKQLAYEKDVLGTLCERLPSFGQYSQSWCCERLNWLPFYWHGYKQTTRYTYRLDLGVGEDALWKNLQENIRREVRKAKGRFGVEVRDASLDELWELNQLTFERQGRSAPYNKVLIENIDSEASKRNSRDCLVAVDDDGNLHATAYIVRDSRTAYYLIGGGDPSLRNSGATSLVLWEAICRQPENIKVFDFEGSMIEPIERFFRAFGAIQTPYFKVSKTPSKFLRLAKNLKSLVC